VTLFGPPGRPGKLTATTGAKPGEITVSWTAPPTNGRAITKYTVTAGAKKVDVTTTRATITGLAAGTNVAVTVVAVNAAGAGPAAGPVTAKPPAKPTVTITSATTGTNSVTVRFTANNGGSPTTCTLTLTGMPALRGNCTVITMTGLAPGQRYTATVTVANAVGSSKASTAVTTKAVFGVVRCVSTDGYCNAGVGIYTAPRQDTSVRTSPNATNGQRFQAFCKVPGTDGNESADAVLFADKYNGGKRSNMWVRIGTNRFVPWVWFNLQPTDNLNLLPPC
jgi:hypothetical protein